MWEAIIAAMAAIFGGVGLKIVESLINRGKTKVDVATQIRDELRIEINSLRKEMREAEQRLDTTRKMYYAVLHAFNMSKTKLIEAGKFEDVKEIEDFLHRRTPDDLIPE